MSRNKIRAAKWAAFPLLVSLWLTIAVGPCIKIVPGYNGEVVDAATNAPLAGAWIEYNVGLERPGGGSGDLSGLLGGQKEEVTTILEPDSWRGYVRSDRSGRFHAPGMIEIGAPFIYYSRGYHVKAYAPEHYLGGAMRVWRNKELPKKIRLQPYAGKTLCGEDKKLRGFVKTWQGQGKDDLKFLAGNTRLLVLTSACGMQERLTEAFNNGGEPAIKLMTDLAMIGAPEKAREKYASWSPLLIAAKEGNREYARLLIERDADVNATDDHGRTPLLLAAKYGRLEIVEMLIAAGADTNVGDDKGRAPLHYACQLGSPSVAKALLNAGADIEARDKQDRTPLDLAIENGNREISNLLIDSGAKADLFALAAVDRWREVKRELDKLDQSGENTKKLERDLVQTAAKRGSLGVLNILLARKPDLESRDSNGLTPLLTAALAGNLEEARALVQWGADVNAVSPDGWSALHYAAFSRNQELVRYLVSFGADPKAVMPEFGWTPLHIAAQYGDEESGKALLEAGADPNARDKSGATPLHLAASQGNAGLVKDLIEAGAKVDAVQSSTGNTPLHLAAMNGNDRAAIILLIARADQEKRNNKGLTPLQAAVHENQSDTEKVLLRLGTKEPSSQGTGDAR